MVTNNVRDFRPRANAAILAGRPGHLGMIYLPGDFSRTRAHAGRIAETLREQLDLHPADDALRDRELWL